MKLTHGQIVGSVVAWAGTSCFGHRKVEGERGFMGTSLYRYNAQYHAEMHGKLFHMKECGWQVAYISSLSFVSLLTCLQVIRHVSMPLSASCLGHCYPLVTLPFQCICLNIVLPSLHVCTSHVHVDYSNSEHK